MRLLFSIIRASVFFTVLLLFILYIVKPSGVVPPWTAGGNEIRFPYSVKTNKPMWIELDTTLIGKGKEFLVLPRMGLSNIEVFLNGKMIWKAGDENHHSRMWTKTFVVPLELKSGRNSLSIKSVILYDVKVNWPPYLTKAPWMRTFLSDLLFSEFPTMFFGMAITLGFLVIRISPQTPDPRGNILFGISLIIAAFFMLDYAYLGFFMSKEAFLIMRRVYYSIPYIALVSYFYSVKRVVLRNPPSNGFVLSMIALSIVPMVIPDFKVARFLAFILSPLMIVLIVDVLVEIIVQKKSEFAGPFTFLTLSTFYSAVSIWKFPSPGLLSFGVACSMFVVIEHIYGEYKSLSTTILLTKKKSLLDPLTGAFNRRVFNEIPTNVKGSLVFVDLNDFKSFNDTYGHEKGDEVLRRFAGIVMSRLRKDDIFIRYGGDEFVIILNGCDPERAVEIMDEIERNFERAVGLSFSYGISDFRGNLIESIKSADRKMYEMKRSRKVGRRYDE